VIQETLDGLTEKRKMKRKEKKKEDMQKKNKAYVMFMRFY
jgi:hypothetical protein